MSKDNQEMHRGTLYIPRSLHDRLRKEAFRNRVSQMDIVRKALEQYFSTNGNISLDKNK